MKGNVIDNFDDFRRLLNDKASVGTYFWLLKDNDFEKIEKDKPIKRRVYTIAREVAKENRNSNIIKYIEFNCRDDYTMKHLYTMIQQFLKKDVKIFLAFFNPEENESTVLFISTKDDYLLENFIGSFLEDT